MVVFGVILCIALVVVIIGWKNRLGNEKKDLLKLWDDGAYDKAFELSRTGLETKPADYFLLTLHGFASYQLAIAQINSFDTLTYIDDCIWSLRKALLIKNGANDGRVQYVLGKAYYYKGSGYADLAIKFLEEARGLSYNAGDIPEYLGLAYAAIQDYRSSVEAFSQALDPFTNVSNAIEEQESGSDYPSDLLLLAIARSYLALEEPDTATAYLMRCMETSKDSNTVITAGLLLGSILAEAGKSGEAEAQYQAILEKDGENAEAHFQLGELYAAGGDTTRARAEWRRALRIDPTHVKARSRLNM
jgi:tetratricopeptide (TPR) repeat protein